MAKEEGLSNIFDAAGKMGKKTQPKESSSQEISSAAASGESGPEENLESRFARCKSYYAQIRKTIEDAYSEEHISPVAVDKYLETPTNFSQGGWHEIERIKKENTEKLKQLLPRRDVPPMEEPPPEEPSPGAGPKEIGPKPNKPKPGFISKKKWIPMR